MELCTFASLILLSLSGSLAASIPGPKLGLVLTPSDQKRTMEVGESLFVQCAPDESLTENAVSELKWTGPSGQEIRNVDRNRIYVQGDGVVKSLYIKSIQDDDQGWYNCSGRHGNGMLTNGVELETYLGITFDAPQEQHATLGEEGIIKCIVNARPQARVTWKRGSRKLVSDDSNRVIVEPGQIKFNPVEKDDEGVYSCEAVVLEKGKFEEKEINFKVYVPPTFEEEIGDQQAIEDEEMVIKCSATGSPEPKYLWKDKDNADLSGKDGYSVNHDGTLIIKKVTIDDAGEYTCVAKNEAAEVSMTFNLEVIMKPKVIKYDNSTAPEEGKAVLECEISGEPLPKVTLRKLSSSMPFTEGLQADDDRITLSVTDQNSVRKVTLEIDEVKRSDDGLYACEASNKGGELYQNGHITVEYMPTFENTPFDEAWSWNNKKVNLTCFAEAIPNATISWIYKEHRNGQELSAEDLRNVVKHGQESKSDLEVTPVDVSYFREYICIARNKLGEVRHVIELKEARIPSTVNQAVFKQMTATTITFTFMGVMDNGGRPVDAYAVQYKEQNKEWDDENRKIWPINVPYILDNLKPRVTYAFRFAARNIVGFGPYGKSLVRTMPEEGKPMKPGVRAAYPDEEKVESIEEPTSYELRWLVPEHNGKEIDKFQIDIFEVNDELETKKDVQMRTYEIKYPGNVMYEITGLEAGHIYKIELRAHNELGFSEQTTIYIKTSNDISPPPGGDGVSGATPTTTTTPSSITTQATSATNPAGLEDVPKESLATGTIVAIVVVAVIVIVLVADLVCCCTNQAGMCWSIKSMMGGAGKKKLKEGKGEKEPLSNNDLKEDDNLNEEKHGSSEPEKKPLSDEVIIKKSGSKDSLGKDTAV